MFFFLPLYDDNPTNRAPVVTYLLIGTCVAVFLWQLGQNAEDVAYSYGMIPAVLFGEGHLPQSLVAVPPWATILTSMFLHGGWLHIGGNMLFLWIFGNNVEDVLGHFRYLLLYLISGVAAAMGQALSDPTSTVPMLGASGAIAGVLGAYLVIYPKANVHVLVLIIIILRIVTVPAWIMLGLWFAVQLASGLFSSGVTGGVAFWAHVSGFTTGIVLLLAMRPASLMLLQPARTAGFIAAPARRFAGRRTFHGSVPDSGSSRFRRRGPWD
ncbi:MAG TPA: rhomboid family intramembrane serine protease [Stellaceae bacterium]|nr:rhomboid family intramembrane serine protease [Stellaceae bacterium]